MTTTKLLWKEFLHHKGNAILALSVVVTTVALVVAALLLTDAYRSQTEANVKAFDDEIRKITKDMGFNIFILPRELNLSNLYAQDFGQETMPQDFVKKLADSKDIVTINHLRPALIRKVNWPEQNDREMILMGVSGVVPWTHRTNNKKPLAEAVPDGSMNLGHQLAKELGIAQGDTVTFRDQSFSIHEVFPARYNTDDITAWIPLPSAQDLLSLPNRINMIQALECNCASLDRLAEIEKEISVILGDDVQVIELTTTAIARAKARTKAKEAGEKSLLFLRKASWIGFSLVTVLGSIVLAMMFLRNALQRIGEIGMLRAIGVTRNQVLGLFLGKALIVGLAGGILGVVAGYVLTVLLGPRVVEAFATPAIDLRMAAVVPAAAAIVTVLATWIPIEAVAGKDPANILRSAS